MKKLILVSVLFFQFIGLAQNGINYKAIVKDGSGNILPNAPITIQFSILQSALFINVYTESHSPTTDFNGLIIINIGEGSIISGDYTIIDWASDSHFLNVQIDTGSGLVDMGTTEFKTMPYAFQAENSTNAITAINVINVPTHNHLGNVWLGTESLTINTSVSTTGVLNLNNSNAGDGLRITSAGVDGVYVASAGDDGIHVASADDIGGVFIGTNSGVHSESSIDINPDLILGGTANTGTGDDGIISSDLNYTSSDIRLKSNDAVIIHLDQDDNEEGQFQIKNGENTTVLDIKENGETTIIGTFIFAGSEVIGPIFELSAIGNLTINGSLTQFSDIRLKKDIEELPYGLNEILQLQPKAYHWKNRKNTHKSLGLIAQEVQPIINDIVSEKDNEQKTMGINYIELIPILINAIKEQQEIIKEQDSEITTLTSELMITNKTQKAINNRLIQLEESLNTSQQ